MLYSGPLLCGFNVPVEGLIGWRRAAVKNFAQQQMHFVVM